MHCNKRSRRSLVGSVVGDNDRSLGRGRDPLDLDSAAVTLSGTVTTIRRRKYCAYKAIWCVRGGGRNARRWLRQYDSQRGGHLHLGVDDVSGRQDDAEESRQQPSEYGNESELCWR